MNDTKKKSKLIWYILFGIISAILCYLFVVVYFYFISPCNISLKLALWPFASEELVADMYLDSVVEIDYTCKDENLDDVQKSVVGVNIRSDGYIVAPFNEFSTCTDETEYRIWTNGGKVYAGKLLYSDKNYNIALMKCENLGGTRADIKIPYVKPNKIENVSLYSSVLAVGSPIKNKTFWKGHIADRDLADVFHDIHTELGDAVEYVLEGCYQISLNPSLTSFSGGAVFDYSGNLLGLSYAETLDDGSYVIMPIYASNFFLNDCIKAYNEERTYTNTLAEGFVGFDQIELAIFEEYLNTDCFYFNGTWNAFSDEVKRYSNSNVSGFYLFEDLSINDEVVLESTNVIINIKINGSSYKIQKRNDLFDALYTAKSGSRITLDYYENTSLGRNIKNVSFNI